MKIENMDDIGTRMTNLGVNKISIYKEYYLKKGGVRGGIQDS